LKLELIQAADECIIELKSIEVSKQKDFPLWLLEVNGTYLERLEMPLAEQVEKEPKR